MMSGRLSVGSPVVSEVVWESQWDVMNTSMCGMGDLARATSIRSSFRRSRKEPHWIQKVRQQLNDQLKNLDNRLDTHLCMLGELQEFYRRRAEVELEYSQKLDKLVKNTIQRHKTEKQRREHWPGYSTYTCWQTLLASTKRQSKDHAIISDIYTNQMCCRLGDLMEDLQRMCKNCREISVISHEELIKVLTELQSAMKTYHIYHGESKQAESKLQYTENQKAKVEQHASKGTLSRKFKNFEKQTEKRRAKFSENKQKALKARNEYLLCLEAANAAIHKFYVDDVPDLIDTMDYGYHNSLGRAMMLHSSCEENLIRSRTGCKDLLNNAIQDLDGRTDKQRFLELHNQSFSLPKKFEFQAHKGDEVCQVSAQSLVQEELLDRLGNLGERLTALKFENEEIWKTVETAEKSLLEMIDVRDYDVTNLFQEEKPPPKSPHEYVKKRSDRLETEAFYVNKFRGYLMGNNLIARLSSKYKLIQKALGEGDHEVHIPGTRPPSLPPKPKKRRTLGKVPLLGQPKLFGGSIVEYTEATGQDIPLIVTSCIRVINLYGMHHQGVFRVSGSQHEINDYKSLYEKGEDPLMDVTDGKDINSIAGVLKLYFRELREPLFPTAMFDELITCSSKSSPDLTEMEAVQECIARIKELLLSLPRPIVVVMRYLFAFLNHLSEYSDENMMDSYNLAICFGPTLLPIPIDRDQVIYQNNVNDLTKILLVHHEEIFPMDGGKMYEKCILEDEGEREDSLGNLSDDDEDATDAASEEGSSWRSRRRIATPEPEVLEAEAQYDFQGRTGRELSFKKGDILVVFNQVSTDWWEGAYCGKEGLIPDKYITVRKRERDDKISLQGTPEEDRRRSTESLPAKPFPHSSSSSGDESIDKSASQPNISHLPVSRTASSERELDSSSLKSASSSDLLASFKIEKTTEDLAHDIDSALAEVMSGIESLEKQQNKEAGSTTNMKKLSNDPKHAPDLVLDLPPSAKTSSKDKSRDSPVSTADVFASPGQSTIKKGVSMSSVPIKAASEGTQPPPPNTSTFTMGRTAPKYNPKTGGPIPVMPAGMSSQTLQALKRNQTTRPQPRTRSPAPKNPERYSDPPAENVLPSSVTPKSQTLPTGTAPDYSSVSFLPDKHVDPPSSSDKPKPPPVRAKPPVMKKPGKSPELTKKLSGSALSTPSSGDEPSA